MDISAPRTTSIKRQLIRSFMLTAGLALLIASSSLFLFDYYNFRTGMIESLTVLAGMTARNSSVAVSFGDVDDARDVLSTLAAQPHVIAGAIYTSDGELFAEYRREDALELALPPVSPPRHDFRDGYVDLFAHIDYDGEMLGTVFVRSDTTELSEHLRGFFLILAIVFAGTFGICYVVASRLREQIANPLAALVEGSGRMAEGDLSVQVRATSDDELGTLARAFNGMTLSLRGLVSQVQSNTEGVTHAAARLTEASLTMERQASRQEVAVERTADSVGRIQTSIHEVNDNVESLSETAIETSAAAVEMDTSIAQIASHMDTLSEVIENTASSVMEMTAVVREIASGADELNRSSESTSTAMRQLSEAVKEVESNAHQSHELSQEASQHAAEGVQSVRETVDGMQEIHSSFEALATIISELNEKSGSIGDVVKVIEGVVEQTNLLALNAAIISSQAGEHGRAFSVVSQEIRNLAERTANSTKLISELIDAVGKGVGDAVSAMNESRRRIEQGVDLSNQAGLILRTIGTSSDESTRRVKEIVEATSRQARDIDLVEQAMSNLRTIATQLNRSTHEQDSAGADIKRGVERMRELGEQVKVSTNEQRQESRMIAQSVEVVSDRIKQILAATQEQRQQGDQITEALEIFKEVHEESTRQSGEIQQNVRELGGRSDELAQEIGRFRLLGAESESRSD